MSSATLPEAAAAYLEALARELADIPSDERSDLLEEVEASLVEAGDDPVARLGTPARFAAELRASAGLPPVPVAATHDPPREPLWQRIKRDPRAHAAAAIARELAPIWWVARAFLVLLVFSTGTQRTYLGILPRPTGHAGLDALICALPLAASIAIGLAGRRRALPLRPLRIAVDVALVACLAFVPSQLNDIRGRATEVVYETATPEPQAGPAVSGVPLSNVYAYDAKGRLLHDIRLYDQDGHPLDIGRGFPDENRRPVFNRDGARLYNAFPIRYFDPGTDRVAHPNAVPEGLKPKPLR